MEYSQVKEAIDTAVTNADSGVSVETGTITNLIISAAAVPIAGLYGYADAVGLKPFADVCSPQDLVRHAKIKGVAIPDGMDDDDLRQAVLTAYRIPPSSADTFSWENEIARIIGDAPNTRFRLYENSAARGMGSADVVLSHNAAEGQVDTVSNQLSNFRPFGLADLQVSKAERKNVQIRLRVIGRAVSFAGLTDAVKENFGEHGIGSIGDDITETSVYGIASNFGVSRAQMFWRETGKSEWETGGAAAIKRFNGYNSVYEQLVVTDCFVEDW